MKKILLLSAIAVFAASCASQKYSRTGNITDDVYFSPGSAEKTASTEPVTTETDGFTYDQSPYTTNPNADYRHYLITTPDSQNVVSGSTNTNYTTNNYYTYNTLSPNPFSYGTPYPAYNYGWNIGLGFGYYSPYGYGSSFGYGYNPWYSGPSCFYPSYGYSPYYGCNSWGYNPWGYNPGWGHYNNPWYNGYPGGGNGGSGSPAPVLSGPRTAYASPFGQTIIGPNGQRVRSTIPVNPTTGNNSVPPAVTRNNPGAGGIQPNVQGPQSHTPTDNDGDRVVYNRQQYAPAAPQVVKPVQTQQPPVQRQPAVPAPAKPAPGVQPPPVVRPAQPQVQPPVQRQPTPPAQVNPAPVQRPQNVQPPAPQVQPPVQRQPVVTPPAPVQRPQNYTPQNNSPQPQPRQNVQPQQNYNNGNTAPQYNPAPSPGRGGNVAPSNPGGGSGGSAPRRR